MAMVDAVYMLPLGGIMTQAGESSRSARSKVFHNFPLFCIHHMNRVTRSQWPCDNIFIFIHHKGRNIQT